MSRAPASQAQRSALAAAEALEGGNEDQARAELKRALAADPHHRLAQNLQRQLTVDPVAAFGRESFPYTLRSNDTLSSVAGRFLGDPYAFYLLARYNGIRVPRQVSSGQSIRVPGRAPAATGAEPRRQGTPAAPVAEAPPVPPAPAAPTPPPAPPPPPSPRLSLAELTLRNAEAAEQSGDLDAALGGYRRAAALDQPGAAQKADAVRKRLVARHGGAARSALAREDLNASIREWDRVLDLDPDNDAARLERQRAIALREKIRSLRN